MNRRVLTVVVLLAAFAAAWWALCGDSVAPESALSPPSNDSAEDAPRPAAPRAARGAAETTDAAAEAGEGSVRGRVVFKPDDESTAPPDLRRIEVVVYLADEPPPGDCVMAVPSTVLASARADEAGQFDIPLPPSPGGRSFVVTARGVDEPFEAEWHEMPVFGGRPEILIRRPRAATPLRVRRADDDLPVAGATVRIGVLTQDAAAVRSAPFFVPRAVGTTDADGRSSVLARVGEQAVVSAPGLATVSVKVRHSDMTVALSPGEPVAGTVVRADGTPVADARLVVASIDGVAWTTDDAGRFRIDALVRSRTDDVDVTAHAAQRWQGELTPGDMDARIVLDPADNAIRGVVLLPDGRPAYFAKVRYGRAADQNTDAEGRFALRPPEDRDSRGLRATNRWGRGVVTASHLAAAEPGRDGESFIGTALATTRPDGSFDDMTIRLAPVGRSWVVVRVLDEHGVRPAHVRVSVSEASLKAVRGDGAECHLARTAPGTLALVSVTDELGYAVRAPTITRSVRTSADDSGEPLELTVPALRPFRVTIDAGGRPIHEFVTETNRDDLADGVARVSLGRTGGAGRPHALEGGWTPRWLAATTNAVTWEIDTSSPGLFAFAECKGMAPAVHPVTQAELAAGGCVVRLDPGCVVTARTSPRGREASDLWHMNPERARGEYTWASVYWGDGTIRFEGVGRGTWYLVHVSRERAETVWKLDVNGDVDLGRIEPLPAVRIRGVVRLADGRPAGGAHVGFTWPDASGYPHGTWARADGTFEVVAALGTDGTLTASKTGYGAVVVALKVDETGVAPPLVLPPEGRVEVRVRAPRDVDPACRVHFETTSPIRAEIDAPLADDEVWTTRPDERFDHVAVYRGLAPGRLLAVAQGTGWRLEAPVTIVAGETAVVTLGDE